MRKVLFAALIASGTLMSAAPSAQAACGIDCWLSNTFSTNDFVGDWLRSNLGGYINQDGSDKNTKLGKSIKAANKIASGWKPGKNYLSKEDASRMKPSCKPSELVKIVIRTKSPEATLKSCFRG